MYKLRKFLAAVTVLITVGFSAAPAMAASGLNCSSTGLSPKQQEQCGACEAAGNSDCVPGDATGTVQSTIRTVINVISVLAGAVAVIMIIVGGFRYITSSGSPESTKGARNTIVYALVGLIVIAFAQLIVHFVLNSVSPDASSGSANSSSNNSSSGPRGINR
jgi:hypothetical protein